MFHFSFPFRVLNVFSAVPSAFVACRPPPPNRKMCQTTTTTTTTTGKFYISTRQRRRYFSRLRLCTYFTDRVSTAVCRRNTRSSGSNCYFYPFDGTNPDVREDRDDGYYFRSAVCPATCNNNGDVTALRSSGSRRRVLSSAATRVRVCRAHYRNVSPAK